MSALVLPSSFCTTFVAGGAGLHSHFLALQVGQFLDVGHALPMAINWRASKEYGSEKSMLCFAFVGDGNGRDHHIAVAPGPGGENAFHGC